MEYLTKTEIIRLNERTLQRHGGNYVPPYNLLHENALDYLVETVAGEMFGQPLYPEISDKAGLYLFSVVSNHVFQDGNKRTGLAAALSFLLRNGYTFQEELTAIQVDGKSIPDGKYNHNAHLYNFTIAVASGQVSLKDCQTWFASNITKQP